MKACKRIAAFSAAVIILLCFAVPSFAAKNITLDHNVNLTLSYKNEGVPIEGAEFSVYLVASADKYGNLKLTDEFSGYNVIIGGKIAQPLQSLASTLEGYVLRDRITPACTEKTDSHGLAFFPGQTNSKLIPGMYLVLGKMTMQHGVLYEPQPFIVSLPSSNSETSDWDYNVIVSPKYQLHTQQIGFKTSRKVLKIWKDDEGTLQHPKEVTVQLLRDGIIYDTVKLNEENNWRYTWNNLDPSYQWIAVEKELDNYTVEVEKEGITFVITNTYKKTTTTTTTTPTETDPTDPTTNTNNDTTKPSGPHTKPNNPSLPYTGQLWWPVPLSAAAGLILIIIGLLRFRGTDYEEN